MRPTRMAFLPLVMIAIVATACANSESGTPESDAKPSRQGPSSTVASSSPGNDAETGASLSEIDPCSLLSSSDAAQFGPVEEPQRKEVGTADTCEWAPDRSQESGERATVSVGIRENAGVQDMNDLGMGTQPAEEGGRQYVRAPSPVGCTIAIGVRETSRVDVVVTGVEDANEGCDMANALVEIVEAKIPRA